MKIVGPCNSDGSVAEDTTAKTTDRAAGSARSLAKTAWQVLLQQFLLDPSGAEACPAQSGSAALTVGGA